MMPLRAFGKCLFLIGILCFQNLWAETQTQSPVHVTITAFNVRMFGYRNDSEIRDPELIKFFKESIPSSDIFVFEEIMDVRRFKKLLPEDWSCISYDHSTPHQFVLLCHSPRFQFKREPTDNNDVIDEVGGVKHTLRPALTAIVSDLRGHDLFRMVGVHLKALPDFTKTRVEQTEIIANYLAHVQNSALPVVIAGDFNTYKAPMNNQSENDTDLILNRLNARDLKMDHVANDLFTFRNNYGQSQFDHFYISRSIRVTKPINVFEVCNLENPTGEGNLNLENYNKIISDHCPVTTEIEL